MPSDLNRLTGPGAPASLDPTRPAPGFRHVFVRNMVLKALVGIFPEERENPQPIRINVDLAVHDIKPGDAPSSTEIVRYDHVAERIRTEVDRGHVSLMESLAERIATTCLQDDRILVVQVRLEKLEAIDDAESVGIAIRRDRS